MRRWFKRAEQPLRYRVAKNSYGSYCVPESSITRPASRTVLSGGIWEAATIDLIRSRCGDGDVVHAGTFFGDFLPAISTALASGAKLWAFEPSHENYRCAKLTCEMNALANVELAHAALGAKRGRASLRTADRGIPMGGKSHIALFGQERVDVLTIDEAVAGRRVSVIQLDVEGFEEQALRGATETIRRCRPFLIVELWEGSTFFESAWFKHSGYRLDHRIDDENVALAPAHA